MNDVKTRRFLSMLLAFILVISAFPVPARAAGAEHNAAALVQSFSYTGLSAVASGATVTITGTASGNTLALNISAGVEVIWKASLTVTSGNAIDISGGGAFTVQGNGARITCSDAHTISASGDDLAITIKDGATVTNTGSIGFAIYYAGTYDSTVTVTIQDGATIDGGIQISDASALTIDNATVQGDTAANLVTVADGTVVIQNGAQVLYTASSGGAVIGKDITITGDGTLVSTSETGSVNAVLSYSGAVVIGDKAKVEHSGENTAAVALGNTTGNATLTVSGGAQVRATGDNASAVSSTSTGKITITGDGTLAEADGRTGVVALSATSAIEIADGAVVRATHSNGRAVYSYGANVTTASVNSGALVWGGAQGALSLADGSSVTVDNATVFMETNYFTNRDANDDAVADVETHDIIPYGAFGGGTGTTTIQNDGIVFAWESNTDTYDEGDDTDIYVTSSGTAVWAISGGDSGIEYTNSGNTGFIKLPVAVTAAARTKEVTPTADIDYAEEKLINLVADADYTIGGADYTADAGGKIAINSAWMGTSIDIVKKATGGNNDSDAQTLPIPARPATAPAPAKTDTTGGGGNGSLTNVDNTMEYKLSQAQNWTQITGTSVTNLPAGTYEVRYKATGGDFASASASLTIAPGSPPYIDPPDIDPPDDSPPDAPNIPDGTTQTPPPADEEPKMVIGGNEVSAGTVTTEGDKTTVTVDAQVLSEHLETAQGGIFIVIAADTGTAAAQIALSNMDAMAEKDVALTIETAGVQYNLPAAALDTAAICSQLGAESSAEVAISIEITTVTGAATQALVDEAVAANGGAIVFPPVEFKVTASCEGKTVEIESFGGYAGRTLEITAEQAAQATTAIVIDADGTVRHVPTRIYEKDGKWYAEINSLTNSTYVLVNRKKTFADADGKWYETAVSEMAGRMIISGSGGLFGGEREITRAEFAAIIVRALGLPENGDGTAFTDVVKSEWYAGAVGKAFEYGLVTGDGDGKFAPDRNITRQEAMMILRRAAAIMGFAGQSGGLGAFGDADSVAVWAIDAASWSVGSGLIVGDGGLLRPQDCITRGETAAVVLRLLQKAGLV